MYRTNYSPSLGFSGMMLRLSCNQNISSARENEDTTQKEAEPRVLIISFEFLDLGIRTPLTTLHSPHVFFFFFSYFELCFSHFNWKMSPGWSENWFLVICFIITYLCCFFLVPDNQQSHLRRGSLTHDVSLRLAREVSLQMWHLSAPHMPIGSVLRSYASLMKSQNTC